MISLRYNILVLVIFNIWFYVAPAFAAVEVARLESSEGTVEGILAPAKDFTPVMAGAVFNEGDVIHTGRASRAGILFVDGVFLRLAENTTLQFQARPITEGGTRPLKLSQGKGYFFSREPASFPVISSPAATTAVRGTEFVIAVTGQETIVSVINGQVESFNKYGSVLAGGGEQTSTKVGEAPVKGILLNPKDAVQWVLYYPNVLVKSDVLPSSKGEAWEKVVDKVFEAQKSGKPEQGLKIIGEYTGAKNTNLLLLEAMLRSQMGQAKEALKILEQGEGLLAKGNTTLGATLLALKGLSSLVVNEKSEAKKYVEEALYKHPNSHAGLMVSSLVSQAHFDLEKAENNLIQLTKIYPEDGLAWARLSELELGFGKIKESKEYISKAESLLPEHSYVRSVSGFLALVEDNPEKAQAEFVSALERDSAFSLPHLGLGLALIRQGNLGEGRREIERAVYLDPLVALYRSYLGKAFFEEEREDLAIKEYDQAIERDLLDPTPYLYRAFAHLSKNQPVDALRDTEKSIELNNNRAVYRSRLLLDQDLGVRSAGLAEVFTALGFSEAARVEAIKSINKDYGNYSAHRLLSESYRTILLNDASISEQKIADLLAPVSLNLFRNPGGDASLNEYNALFDRDEHRTEVNFTGGTQNDVIAPGITQAGKLGNFGYLLGQDSVLTDGRKSDNYSRRYRGRAAAQYQASYADRISIETDGIYQKRVDDAGDPNEVKFEGYSADLGYHRRLGAGSKVLAQVTFDNQRNNFFTRGLSRFIHLDEISGGEVLPSEFDILLNEFSRERVKSLRSSAQHIYDSRWFSTVVGTQVYFSDIDRDENSKIIDDEIGIYPDINHFLRTRGYNDLDSQDFYTYGTIHLAPWIDLNVGATYTQIELEERELPPFISDSYNKSKLNPKFGVTLYPTGDTTVRGAYFETVRKSSLEDNASLEPTIIGGLNQRFTDVSGAKARNVGVALDHKWSGKTYMGLEGIHRDVIDENRSALSFLTQDFDAFSESVGTEVIDVFENHQDQDIAKAYFYQVITPQVVGTLDYQWSSFERTAAEVAQDLTLNKIGIGLRYFNPTGWFAFSTATWREEDREGSDFFDDGVNDFWIVDAGLGYRLPKRHGSIQLQFTNLFEQDFTYDQSLGIEEFVRPDFGALLVFAANF